MKASVPEWIKERAASPPELATATFVQPDPKVVARLGKLARREVKRSRHRRSRERERRLARQVRELRALMRPVVEQAPRVVRPARVCVLAHRRPRLARRRGAGRPRGAASRSSARSGDSGSSGDGSGGSEPPAALAGSWAGRGVLAAGLVLCGRAGR